MYVRRDVNKNARFGVLLACACGPDVQADRCSRRVIRESRRVECIANDAFLQLRVQMAPRVLVPESFRELIADQRV